MLVILNCVPPPYHIIESEHRYMVGCSSPSLRPPHRRNVHLHLECYPAMLHHMIQFVSQLLLLEAVSPIRNRKNNIIPFNHAIVVVVLLVFAIIM